MKGTLFNVFGIAIVIGLLMLLSAPVIPKPPGRKAGDRREAINNAKQIFLALLDHQERYGSFPNEETMKKVAAEKGIAPFSLTTSNDYFRLLLAGGAASEKIGYCRYPALPTHRPDNVISPLEQAFAKGEVGFAYVANLPADAPADTPLLVAPLIPGTLQFDQKPFDGHAVIVFMDGSAKSMTIRQDNGLVMINAAKTLFDLSAPCWKGKAPELKYPAR
ncbi:hypothetical protein [Luteolibacter soli]|uniref:Uncharacterized protein n=1 Tax=Luteolibacter soli TaxID=3135280 RepID=A0ABU9APZ8_9BACT